MNKIQPFVIKAKIAPPVISINMLKRDNLINRVQQLRGKRITTITAPGGYGKTVLASQIVKYSKKPFVWYQIDKEDNDPAIFFYYFIKAFSEFIKDFDMRFNFSHNIDKDANSVAYNIVTFLISEIEKINMGRIYVVLDDFHFIQDKIIIKFLNMFLKYMPEKIHLIIVGRSCLGVDLAKSKAYGYLIELDKSNLMFSYEDFISFYNLQPSFELDENQCKNIYNRSEGWPMALNIFLQESDKYYSHIKESKESTEYKEKVFFNFFVSQVFNDLSESIQSFLLSISVIDKITLDICAYVSGNRNAEEILNFLVENNVFINRLSTKEKVYRCHQLFREFLQEKLGNKINVMYKRAGEYCYSIKKYSEAMEYLIKSNNVDYAIEIFKFAGIESVRNVRLKTVERWLAYFYTSNYKDNEWVLLVQSYIYVYKGMFSKAEKLLNYVIDYFYKSDTCGHCIALMIQARILFYRHSIESYINTVEVVISKSDEIDDFTLYDAFIQKAYGHIIKGDISDAVVTLKVGIETLNRRGSDRFAIFIQRYLTVAYFMNFEYCKAIHHYEITNSMSLEEINLTECFSVDLYAARIYRDMGRLEEAKKMMEKTIRRKEALGYVEDIFAVYYQLATLYRDIGDYEAAMKYANLSGELLKQDGNLMEIAYLVRVLKGLILSDKGDAIQGMKIGEEALLELINAESKFMVEVAYHSVGIISIRADKIEKAKIYFENGYKLSQKSGVKSMIPVCGGFLAGIYIEENYEKSLFYTKQSLELSAKQNYIQVYITNSEMNECLVIGLIHNIELDFISKIIYKLNVDRKKEIIKLLKRYGNEECLEKLHKIIKLDEKILDDVDNKIDIAFLKLYGEKENCFVEIFRKLNQPFTPCIIVACFGNFRIYAPLIEEGRIKWRTNKSKELLAYFIDNKDKELSTEVILTDVWQDVPVDKARNIFYTNIALVRQILKKCNLLQNLQKVQSGYIFRGSGIYCDSWIIREKIKDIENLDDRIKEKFLDALRKGYLKDIYSEWAIEQRMEYEKLCDKIL
ncbi:tetratricopeptide repeat protein [Clostridium thailandense]|uniref:tetratricopeptide repeat protein n=1 Tax=Clostridium thailandense TaxID=2794346 RepID=UPI003989D575